MNETQREGVDQALGDKVWVFNGESTSSHNLAFPSAVFSSRAMAEAWIAQWRLSGVHTSYLLKRLGI